MNVNNDLIGARFERLVVTGFVGLDKFNRKIWKCRCDCGNECNAAGINLRGRIKRSCGCLSKELFQKNRVIHKKDLSGIRFGRLTAINETGRDKWNSVVWLCICECGKTTEVSAHTLLAGNTRSCGCLQREAVRRTGRSGKHGLSRDANGKKNRLFRIWTGMKKRCFNPNVPEYHNYGGRGITICKEWLDYAIFHKWAMSNGYKPHLSIERMDINSGYNPINCSWIPRGDQARNKRNTIRVTYMGSTKTLKDWSAEIGICYGTLFTRIRNLGWSVDDAFMRPIEIHRRKENKS